MRSVKKCVRVGAIIRPGKGDRRQFNADGKWVVFSRCAPLLTLDNMEAIMPDDWGIQYPVWDALTQWKQNKVVQYGNDTNGNKLFWKAKADNVGEEPTEDSLFWSKYNILSDFLERMTRNGIATAIQTFTQIKQLDKETRNLLERRTFLMVPDAYGQPCKIIINWLALKLSRFVQWE